MSAAAVAQAQAGAAVTAHGSAKGTTGGKGSALNLFDRYLKSTKGQGGRNFFYANPNPNPELWALPLCFHTQICLFWGPRGAELTRNLRS